MHKGSVSRRSIILGAMALTATAFPMPGQAASATGNGRLQVVPETPLQIAAPKPGTHRLGLDDPRDALLYVPNGHDPARPAPLVVMFHGAGGVAGHAVPLLQGHADRHGILLLAPDSRARDTWDIIHGGYGPDIRFLERALQHVFQNFAVDPARTAVGGFSDGASYALCVGLMNGDIFRYILAFSPGFEAASHRNGMPRIFISHGVRDEVLPIDLCGRRLARELSGAGYDMDYREFDGGHVVPPEMVDAAVSRLLT